MKIVLQSLSLLPVYESSTHSLVNELFVPLLSTSIKYDRGVGYFTSGWLRLVSEGLVQFARNGGKARIVVSPELASEDVEAVLTGEEARYNDVLKQHYEVSLEVLETTLERNTLNALSWMVADGLLSFRVAVPRSRESLGLYHDKLAVFSDLAEHSVALHGSLNDTVHGSLNGEAFSVFRSWIEGERPHLIAHSSRFENLWNDKNLQFHVLPFPRAVQERLVSIHSAYRPYSPIEDEQNLHGVEQTPPPITLRDPQIEAIAKWEASGFRGIFEMATGTGKTIAALGAAKRRLEGNGQLLLIVLVPYIHLIKQWENVCRRFGLSSIVCCSSASPKWVAELQSKIENYNLTSSTHLVVISSMETACLERFSRPLRSVDRGKTMLIGDEAHHLGAPDLKKGLIESASMRLGLSATPQRWFDEEGSRVIEDYFGRTCFEFTLEQAIGEYLTPYYYYPILTTLNDRELTEYEDLSKRIALLIGSSDQSHEIAESLKLLLIKRSRIITSAESKKLALGDLLNKLKNEAELDQHQLSHLLVYCAPGESKEVLSLVSSHGIMTHEFIHTVDSSSRQDLLTRFGSGELQALVAIKCLDEGVDIPAAKTAILMASTTNPMEFIQRRGRILRLSEGKNIAQIYDFIVIPRDDPSDSEVSILRREMPRFAEFCSSAANEFQARATIRDQLDRLGLLHLLDLRPWDILRALGEA